MHEVDIFKIHLTVSFSPQEWLPVIRKFHVLELSPFCSWQIVFMNSFYIFFYIIIKNLFLIFLQKTCLIGSIISKPSKQTTFFKNSVKNRFFTIKFCFTSGIKFIFFWDGVFDLSMYRFVQTGSRKKISMNPNVTNKNDHIKKKK